MMRKLAVCVLLAGGAALIAAPARTASYYYYDASPRIITIEPAQEIEPPPRPRPVPRRVVPPSLPPAPAMSAPLPQWRRAVREVVAPRPAPRDSAAARAVERGMLGDEPAAIASPPPPPSPPAVPLRPRTVLAPPPYAAGPTPLKPLSHRDSARFAPPDQPATAAAAAVPALDEPAPAGR